MLVLTRKVGESIQIGDHVTVVVQRISGNRVALSFEAPRDVRILRGELDQFEAHATQPLDHQEACPAAAEPAEAFLAALDGAVLV